MDQLPYVLDRNRRDVVLAALIERCPERVWTLLAAHVRTNHVHAVVEAEARPERVMNDLKSFSSRCLNHAGFDEPTCKRWARHGSTRWLWNQQDVSARPDWRQPMYCLLVLASIRHARVLGNANAMSFYQELGRKTADCPPRRR